MDSQGLVQCIDPSSEQFVAPFSKIEKVSHKRIAPPSAVIFLAGFGSKIRQNVCYLQRTNLSWSLAYSLGQEFGPTKIIS